MGVVQKDMGVEVETLQPGDGKNYPKQGDYLTMHYTGTLKSDGTKFDSSVDKQRPFKFNIGVQQVIKGWDRGVIKMSLGEKARLDISSDYGYGAAGAGGVIPPHADLIFEVELLAINGVFPESELHRCAECAIQENAPKAFNLCSACKKVFYCGRECQLKNWPQHKFFCKTL